VPLEGHWERINTPLRATTRRERRILWVLGAVLAVAAVVATIAAIGSSPPNTPAGCIRIEVPSTMGGATSQLCGHGVRTFCRSPAAHTPPLESIALPKCRDAGYR
jgi:hypothetical protein